jgi:hypothetical protein
MSAIDLCAFTHPASVRRGLVAEASHLRDAVRAASLPLPVTIAVATCLSLVIHVAGGEVR